MVVFAESWRQREIYWYFLLRANLTPPRRPAENFPVSRRVNGTFHSEPRPQEISPLTLVLDLDHSGSGTSGNW